MRQHQDGYIESLAYVVMPDHLHWLLQLRSDRTLGVCMNLVKSLSAREISRHCGQRGPVWQRGYHDRALRKEDDVVRIARYIIANPLRSGLVDSIRRYPLWDAKWL
jgi:REP element-mobilizing transposase RayT